MNKTTTILLAGITAITMTACGGGSSSNTNNGGGDTSIDYSGEYQIIATSNTDYASNGLRCRGADGTLYVDDNYQLSGNVLSDWDDYYNITGDVTDSGYIQGGFARSYDPDLVATFDGQLTSTGGYGQWEDRLNCAGTWEASRR